MSARNIIHWHRIRSIRDALSVVIATAGGAGLVPRAPGTMGTLVAMPLALLIREWPVGLRLGIWGLIAVAGTWAATAFDELMQTGDNQCIVIDEVLGLGITTWTLSHVESGPAWIAAFVLFRIFDVIKIYPVRIVDQWSKHKSKDGTRFAKWWGGFGVMADDVLAGLQGLAVMVILQRFQIFPS